MTCEKKIEVPFKITKSEVIKEENGDEFFHFWGYASTFGNIDKANDIMMAGCFQSSIERLKAQGVDLPALWQHESDMPIGVYPAKDLKEDSNGLYVHGTLPLEDTFVKGRVKPQMKVGSVRKMSIGFNVIKYSEENLEELNKWVTKYEDVSLMEVSLVTFACNDLADVTATKNNKEKEMIEKAETLADVEKFLTAKGISKSESKAVISKTYAIKSEQRDADLEKEREEKEQRDAVETAKALDVLNSTLNNFNKKLTEK